LLLLLLLLLCTLLLLLRLLQPLQHRLVPVAGEEQPEGKALEQHLHVLLRSHAPVQRQALPVSTTLPATPAAGAALHSGTLPPSAASSQRPATPPT
jgi:hypothetical protein